MKLIDADNHTKEMRRAAEDEAWRGPFSWTRVINAALKAAPAVPYVSLETFREYAQHKIGCDYRNSGCTVFENGVAIQTNLGKCTCGLSDYENAYKDVNLKRESELRALKAAVVNLEGIQSLSHGKDSQIYETAGMALAEIKTLLND